MFDPTKLPDEIRGVLASSLMLPLTAGEIFERLPSRDALLADCARRSDASEAYELATRLISDVLLRRLGGEVAFEVIEGNGLAVDLGDTLLTTATGMVVVYRLHELAAEGARF